MICSLVGVGEEDVVLLGRRSGVVSLSGERARILVETCLFGKDARTETIAKDCNSFIIRKDLLITSWIHYL